MNRNLVIAAGLGVVALLGAAAWGKSKLSSSAYDTCIASYQNIQPQHRGPFCQCVSTNIDKGIPLLAFIPVLGSFVSSETQRDNVSKAALRTCAP